VLSNLGTLLAIGALTSLSAGPPPLFPAPGSVDVPICGEHGFVSIPLGPVPQDQRHDCKGGCHAICHRKDIAEEEE